ncbi:hypothetical protein [Nocardia implantans]|uniref:Uncharacterized protein n=1 Tax=Nocardia implantans TaxID=3108168 RepID=A0ABU6B280_9NOCA|nr:MULTISPECIES: hypothetical protein [unclassified Nocardia]MBF6195008.1 hypothetical protein [Nocardia beijingensis]MEA3530331.1 hypothetical protein [Nocardia sp. CDC192]MEB3513809.1 hypothetical protein [Nocardia sp. CDC186]
MAYLCGHLQEIRSTLGDDETDASTPLRKLLDAVRSGSGADIATTLDAVHAALRTVGDARGIYGHHRGLTPVGVHSIEVVYRCPLERCDGRGRDEVDADPPHCAISGQELRRERLS